MPLESEEFCREELWLHAGQCQQDHINSMTTSNRLITKSKTGFLWVGEVSPFAMLLLQCSACPSRARRRTPAVALELRSSLRTQGRAWSAGKVSQNGKTNQSCLSNPEKRDGTHGISAGIRQGQHSRA